MRTLTKDNKRALGHAKKEDLFKMLLDIEEILQRRTWNGLNTEERYISNIVNEGFQGLYFK